MVLSIAERTQTDYRENTLGTKIRGVGAVAVGAAIMGGIVGGISVLNGALRVVGRLVPRRFNERTLDTNLLQPTIAPDSSTQPVAGFPEYS